MPIPRRHHASEATIPHLRLGAATLAAMLCASACSSAVDASPLDVRSVAVEATYPLTRTLNVELATAAPVTVEYRTEGSAPLTVTAEDGRTHTLLLTGLLPGRTYQWAIKGSTAEGTFATEELPADLAAVELEASGALTIPWVLLHLFDAEGFTGYVVVDGAGAVRWYWRTEEFPFGMTRRANGNFVFLDRGRGLVEVAPDGAVAHELPQDEARGQMHHDVIATPSNTLLVIAFDTRDVDGAPLKGDAIWEWTPETGTMVRRWTGWDMLDPRADRGPDFFDSEWLHLNALATGPRGNVLVSVHHLNQILSIAPDWRSLEWRLGGIGATIQMPEGGRFSGQHAIREIAPDTFLLFDNGIEHRERSRALDFTLTGGTPKVLRDWGPLPDNFASAVGSARRTPDGNTLVGFGMRTGLAGSTGPMEAYQVSPSGEVLWRLEVRGPRVMFRAEPLQAIGREVAPQPSSTTP